jgi:palmitoyltransferase
MSSSSYGLHTSYEPRKLNTIYRCCKFVPCITFVFTILLFFWTLWTLILQNNNIFLFLLLATKIYLNWFAIVHARGKFETLILPTTQSSVTSSYVSLQKIWFCTKCKMDTFYECHHCPLCDVCIIQRDHHCFFLGTCITRQNMKHFIVFCVYSALMCFYTGLTLIADLKLPNLTLYFLPVCIGYFLAGTSVSLTTLVNVLLTNVVISSGFLTLCFGCYQIGIVCLARLPYSSDIERSNGYLKNFLCAFEGPCGLLNFMFPLSLLSIDSKSKPYIANKSV